METLTNCVVVCGPTASGKTHLAVTLASRFNGEIISADSRQVYRGMDIGTGKDLHEYNTENGAVPFHLIDIVDPGDVYTIYHFKRDFSNAFAGIQKRDHTPFLTGGSGLYIESILRNFNIPSVPENISFREQQMQRDKDILISELSKLSPTLHARADLSSKKRVIRALEIAAFTNTNNDTTVSEPTIKPLVLCTRWERLLLYNRIDQRLHERLKTGMIDEVKSLMDLGVSKARLVQFGMEYKHIVRYLVGDISYDEMICTLTRDIHNLAKRQDTWFRGMERRGVMVNWIDHSDERIAIELVAKHLDLPL